MEPFSFTYPSVIMWLRLMLLGYVAMVLMTTNCRLCSSTRKQTPTQILTHVRIRTSLSRFNPYF